MASASTSSSAASSLPSSSASVGLVLGSRPKEPYLAITCPYPSCRVQLEYLPPSAAQVANLLTSQKTFKVVCFSCKGRFEPPNSARLLREARGKRVATDDAAPPPPVSKRRIGTDARPLDLEYYDILDLPPTCTQDDIKKAYRKLAIKLHPDKNPNNPEVEELFKKLATAYTVLSDPELRHKYNEFGASTPGLVPEDGLVDPEEVFGSLFGGGRFKDIIGTISIGKDMKEALQQDAEELERQAEAEGKEAANNANGTTPSATPATSSALTPEAKVAKEEKERAKADERAKQREERVKKLAEHLVRRLSVYTESVRGIGNGEEALKEEVKKSFREITRLEAEELKAESYGVELLHVVGFIYLSKSKHYLASSYGPLWGLGGMYHSLTSSAHIVSSTVSTVRAALELKNVFEELKKAEDGGITEERRKELEEKAATKGMQALFKGASLEVESVLREVCDRVLYPSPLPDGAGEGSISKETQKLRAIALGIVGSVYTEVKAATAGGIAGDDEYVKIDAKAT